MLAGGVISGMTAVFGLLQLVALYLSIIYVVTTYNIGADLCWCR